MCGSEVPRLRPVTVEGTRLMLCDRCAKFGVEVRTPRTRKAGTPVRPRPSSAPVAPTTFELAEDYPRRIRTARETLGWKREELATRINEKLSIIEKLEKGKIRPDDALLSKLERALHVRLRERVEEAPAPTKSDRRPVTLGDLIRREG